ncbi:MAG: methylisocitrate lyase [Aquiluna sp.]|nr:methylisocitrate lyase [Aquiluna sp.]
MLYEKKSATQKRQELRGRLAKGDLLQFPGAFNPLSARLIEKQDFDGVYISGAVMSAELGLPDIGLTTLSEVRSRAEQISRMTKLPTLVDADTGFGEAMNLARAVQELEAAGVSAIHIEDQVNPKRCGHLDGKAVVDQSTAIQRITAAANARIDESMIIMARTDMRATDGLDAAIERMRALEEAGADLLFPEALTSLEEYRIVKSATKVPILANMTEFGKTELFTKAQLAEVGVSIIIYPVSLLRSAMGAAEKTLAAIKRYGTQTSEVEKMQTRAELYELLDYSSYEGFDKKVFNQGLT